VKAIVKRLSWSILIFYLSMLLFLAIPRIAFTEWLGVPMYQGRIKAFHNAAFWYSRSKLVPNKGEKVTDPSFGQVQGLTESGQVVIKIAKGSEWIVMTLPLAGVEITDTYRAAVHMQSLRHITAEIDVYEEAPDLEDRYSVVIWVHQKPVNLVLVEDGYAKPEPQPVTSIMDRSYAMYYWRLATGRNSDD
jgi:hypothetical protein